MSISNSLSGRLSGSRLLLKAIPLLLLLPLLWVEGLWADVSVPDAPVAALDNGQATETWTVYAGLDDGPDGRNATSDACSQSGLVTEATLSILDSEVIEGDEGTADMTFIVSLSKASSSDVCVEYRTSDNTANAGEDYVAASGALTFAAGETSKSITVSVIGDNLYADEDGDESFTVSLISSSANVADGDAVGTITNDDMTIEESLDDLKALLRPFYTDFREQKRYSKEIPIDLGGDGDEDLIVLVASTVENLTNDWLVEAYPLSYFVNNKGNGFERVDTDIDMHSRYYEAADVNGDGLDDLISVADGDIDFVAGGLHDSVYAFINDGDGNFSITQNNLPIAELDAFMATGGFPTPSDQSLFFSNIHAVDLNNDGYKEILLGPANIPNWYALTDPLMPILRNENGTFTFDYVADTLDILIPALEGPSVPAVVGMEDIDINGDGCTDLMFHQTDYQENSAVTTYESDCNGSLSEVFHYQFSKPGWTAQFFIADVTADGIDDFYGQYNAGQLALFTNNNDETYAHSEIDEVTHPSFDLATYIRIMLWKSVPHVLVITNVAPGDRNLSLDVTANNGGSEITSYNATCTDGTNTYTGTSPSSPITVSGLTNGVAYTCTVTATNSVGTSLVSAATAPTTPVGSTSAAGDQGLNDIEAFTERFYTVVLGRDPDQGGFDNWVAALTGRTLTGSDLARGFFLSPEYTNKQKSDSAFLDDCYQAYFDRAADAGGKQGWLGALAQGMTRTEVLDGFSGSQEFIALAESYGIRPFEVYDVSDGESSAAEAIPTLPVAVLLLLTGLLSLFGFRRLRLV